MIALSPKKCEAVFGQGEGPLKMREAVSRHKQGPSRKPFPARETKAAPNYGRAYDRT
jgi:hypothetical protein